MKRALLRLLAFADDALCCVEIALVTASLLAMVGLYFAQVLMRNLGEGGVPWFQTVVQHLVLWVGMLGASLCVRERKHIAIEALTAGVSPGGRRVAEGLVDVSTALLCLVLARIAWGYVATYEMPEDRLLATVGGLEIKRWWSLAILPAGFLAMAARYVHATVRRIFVDEPVPAAAGLQAELEDWERRHSQDPDREDEAP
ncbi:MAG: TRAP transporter small permease [Planctomycetota bacterium]|nr:MAG: TRAP transporter small permease [Planctomycetota bacterium]